MLVFTDKTLTDFASDYTLEVKTVETINEYILDYYGDGSAFYEFLNNVILQLKHPYFYLQNIPENSRNLINIVKSIFLNYFSEEKFNKFLKDIDLNNYIQDAISAFIDVDFISNFVDYLERFQNNISKEYIYLNSDYIIDDKLFFIEKIYKDATNIILAYNKNIGIQFDYTVNINYGSNFSSYSNNRIVINLDSYDKILFYYPENTVFKFAFKTYYNRNYIDIYTPFILFIDKYKMLTRLIKEFLNIELPFLIHDDNVYQQKFKNYYEQRLNLYLATIINI